jgi:hypothetical protein
VKIAPIKNKRAEINAIELCMVITTFMVDLSIKKLAITVASPNVSVPIPSHNMGQEPVRRKLLAAMNAIKNEGKPIKIRLSEKLKFSGS